MLVHKSDAGETLPITVEPLRDGAGVFLRQGRSFFMLPADAWPDLVDRIEDVLNPRPAAVTPAKLAKQLGELDVHTSTEAAG